MPPKQLAQFSGAQDFRVLVADEQQLLAIDEQQIIRAVRLVLADSPFKRAEVSVAVVDDSAIHALNAEFLSHDYPTDVLSFVLEESAVALEGELVVSSETALREAAEAVWAPGDELLLYVIHGALHLVGYDDQNLEARRRMLAAELATLSQLGVTLPADQSRWRAIPKPSEENSQ